MYLPIYLGDGHPGRDGGVREEAGGGPDHGGQHGRPVTLRHRQYTDQDGGP